VGGRHLLLSPHVHRAVPRQASARALYLRDGARSAVWNTTAAVRVRPRSSSPRARSSHLVPPSLSSQFHPNIFPDGTLCLDLIQDQWSPVYTVSSILLAIRSLLTDPNCSSPANPEAAHLYQTDRKQYSRKVRRVAEKSVC